ncbi:hypothetical protein [Pseudomonas sp.]|uniref:hypothetical protein n=1 Tax=Pseudomonas sp. TaxID=306 RepID=UPI002631E87A|nr:hypothetical protein [Pseudomonas sp.]
MPIPNTVHLRTIDRQTLGDNPAFGTRASATGNRHVDAPAEKSSHGQELVQLRGEIKRELECYQYHMRFAGYEDVRPHPLSTGQKIKDWLVWMKMAGSGHQPGHIPNRALQQAWKANARLSRLTQRYIPLARAEALSLMGEQVMDAQDRLKGLSGDKAAVSRAHVDQLKERFEAAKFAFAIDVGEAFARDTVPFLPLLNLTTYRVIQQAGENLADAASVAQGVFAQQCVRLPRLPADQARLYHEDALQAAALDHGTNIVDDLREKSAAARTAGEPWLQGFATHVRKVLSHIDSALSLPGTDAVELEEVHTRLMDLAAKASPSAPGSDGLMYNDVYRETTQRIESPGYQQAVQQGLATIGNWLFTTGLLMTQRVGNAVEQNPGRALGALAAYAAVSSFYNHWFLPPSGALDEPATRDGRTQLAIEVDMALGKSLPGHPDALVGQMLQDALGGSGSRSRRSASSNGDDPETSQARIKALLSEKVDVDGQVVGDVIRKGGGIPDSVDDQSLASAINLGLTRFDVKEASLQAAYAKQLDENIGTLAADSVEMMVALYAPILNPSAAVDDIIEQRISEYEKQTGIITHLSPQSSLRVQYNEVQPHDPNLHRTAVRKHFKNYSLKEVVLDAHKRDVGLMRGPFGQTYKVVGVEHQRLIEFIGKDAIQAKLEADFKAYKTQPEIKSRTASFYQGRIMNAGLNYLETTPLTHPGHKLMADFLNGDLQASQVKFHGANVNGVFAVTQGQTALLCSVDDDACFFIGEKVNRYWKFGALREENMPGYPSDPEFKKWILMKLPIIEQVKTSRNPAAFEVTKTKYSTNAQIGMGRNGGRVVTKPLSFETSDNVKKLSERLFEANMDRIASDIDTLIFTDWERYGLEGLKVMQGLLELFGYLSLAMSSGTGSFLARALGYAAPSLVIGASAGVSGLQGAISDDPTERDAANKRAFTSMITTGVSMALGPTIATIGKGRDLAAMLKYHRSTNEYIIRPETFRIINEALVKKFGAQSAAAGFASSGSARLVPAISQKAGSSGLNAPSQAANSLSSTLRGAGKPLPWSKLDSEGRIERLSTKVVNSRVARKLTARTSEQAVRQSIANNLRLESTGAAKQQFGWRSERVEARLARSRLEADSKRLDEVDQFVQTLRDHPPTLKTQEINLPPEKGAATWVASTSLSKVPQERIIQTIEQFRQADLTSIKVIDAIHGALSGKGDRILAGGFRPSGQVTSVGTDIAHGAYEKSLKLFQVPEGLSPAAWLFALTQSYQPFATNNDVLARVLYALSELQGANNNRFMALEKITEKRLSPEVAVPKKPLPIKPTVPAQAPIIDTRVEPFREIGANPSRELPLKMHGYMSKFRSNPHLSEAFMAPAGQCAKAAGIVAQFMRANEFTNIKFRAMLIWNSPNPDGVTNHFFPIGDLDGKTYAFDLTAPQFAGKGMPSLSEPFILPEPALMGLYQTANARTFIKYKDFFNLELAENAFSGFRTPPPDEFIAGGHILSHGWHKPAIAQPAVAPLNVAALEPHKPTPAIARLGGKDFDNRKANRQAAQPTPVYSFESQIIGPKTWAALSDKNKINYLVNRLLSEESVQSLIGATSKATVAQTIRDNLELDGLGVPRQRFAWGSLQSEIGHGLRRLAKDRDRLSKTDNALQAMLEKPPVVSTELVLGNPQQQAAKWIVGESRSSGLTEEEVTNVLLRNQNSDLSDLNQIDRIHAEIYQPSPGEPYRVFRSSSDPVFMASRIGRAGFARMLPQLAGSAQQGKLPMAQGLFAAAVRYHPYGDGNGRLARTLYALAQINESGPFFRKLTPAGEDTLNPRD